LLRPLYDLKWNILGKNTQRDKINFDSLYSTEEARWVHSGAVTTVEDGLDSVGAL